jgi:hypothetical protein
MKQYSYLKIALLLVVFSISNAQEKNIFDTARFGSVAEMEKLMMADVNIINAKDENGFTPLILAAYRNNEKVVNFLAPKVSTIDHSCMSGTALTAASYKGLTSVVAVLLQNNANPNIADNQGSTPLIYATLSKNEAIINLLLKHGASKSHKDDRGNSALQYALISNDTTIINLLK